MFQDLLNYFYIYYIKHHISWTTITSGSHLIDIAVSATPYFILLFIITTYCIITITSIIIIIYSQITSQTYIKSQFPPKLTNP